MKRTVTVALLYALVVSAAMPAVAQRPHPIRKKSIVDLEPSVRPEVDEAAPLPEVKLRSQTRFASVDAVSDGSGVLISWTMAAEEKNAGFYIYRLGDDGKPVNSSMIIGSWGKSGSRVVTGERYQYFDTTGAPSSVYVVRATEISGRVIASSEVMPQVVEDLHATTGFTSEELAAAAISETKSVEAARVEMESDLFEVYQSNLQTPDPATQKFVAGQPGAKIGVKKEGMYRVQRSQLPSAIFDNTNTANWRLYTDGNEQAINVGPNGQYIEFYGKGIDTAESDTRVYYLLVDTVPGKRIGTKFLRAFGGIVPAKTYAFTTEQRERTSYVATIHNGDAENYWGRAISSVPDPVPLSVSLPGADTSAGDATITFKFQGYVGATHQVTPVINGHALPAASGDGLNPFTKQYTVPGSYLADGANSINFTSGSAADFSLFDSVTVSYQRRYKADQNRIAFTTPNMRKVSVDGFSSSSVRVFDTTVDGAPVQIGNVSITANGPTFTASVPSSRPAVLYGVEDSGLLQPASITTNNPSTLSMPANAANAVIISYSSSDMMATAQNWATYRRSAAGGSYNVKVVDVEDIYDEFNYGVPSAASLKGFLAYANGNWQTKPQYILMLGDGTVDPRNYEGFGYWNQIPVKYVDLYDGESASDEALADFDNDGLSELAIGRIPLRTGAQAATVLNKTIAYETAAQQTFNRGALFAYDQPVGWDFENMSQLIRSKLPASMPVDFVQRKTDGSSLPALTASLNSGKLVVNYAGHGSSGVWGFNNPYLFTLNDANALNGQSGSLYTMLTCLNGYFIRSNVDSLSEALLKVQNGGAVATWASTAETFPNIQQDMGRRFYEQLAGDTITRLGDLVKDAKTVVPFGSDDVRYSWVLLGDPMLKVP